MEKGKLDGLACICNQNISVLKSSIWKVNGNLFIKNESELKAVR